MGTVYLKKKKEKEKGRRRRILIIYKCDVVDGGKNCSQIAL